MAVAREDLIDSGQPWLGRVPAAWRLAPLGVFFDERKSIVSDADFAPLSVTKGGVVPQLDTAAKTDNNDNRKLVCVGDFVINSRSDRKGSSGVSQLDGSVSVVYTVLTPRPEVHAPFVHHLLRSVPFQEEFYRWGTGIVDDLWSTRYSSMKRITLAMPSLDEQRAIAEYLDDETAKIDTLIAKQEQLIETLSELRSSMIFNLVTKGSTVPAHLRESGVRWLGHVPAHWRVGNIRRFATMKTGHTPSRGVPEYWDPAEIPWFTLADVWQLRDGRLMEVGEPKTGISRIGLANSAAELLPARTVMLSRTASVGFSGIMPIAMATSQDFWNWVCGPDLLPEYLVYVFRAMVGEFGAMTIGSTHKTIYQPVAAAMVIPVPPMREQGNIVTVLSQELTRIDSLSDRASRLISLAQERRSALITASVTGQIDVQGAA